MTDTENSGVFSVERFSDYPRGEAPACADCGMRRDLIGPFDFDGNVTEGGDMVCRRCAESRGADLSHCTCGTSSPKGITCPGCRDYLGGASGKRDTED